VALRKIGFILVCAILAGCALERASQEYQTARIDEAIAKYKAAAATVKLGDSRDKVLDLLQPTQFELESNEIKPPVALASQTDSGVETMVVIHFFRSARHADERPDANGMAPEDDFTPYIFTDDVLTGVGWTALATHQIRKPVAHTPKDKSKEACQAFGPLAGCF